jgi:hypothetical protein
MLTNEQIEQFITLTVMMSEPFAPTDSDVPPIDEKFMSHFSIGSILDWQTKQR